MFEQDPLAAGLENRLATMGPGLPPVGPAADPFSAGWLSSTDPSNRGPRFAFATIVDCAAGAHCYRALTGPGSLVWCSPAGHSSFASFGARPLNSVRLGSRVLLCRHDSVPDVADIVAVLPHFSVHRQFQPADALWPFFRSGHSSDVAHRLPITLSAQACADTHKAPAGVDVTDFSAGRPLDSTTVGEMGSITETGVGLAVDPFHFGLRVDELTGVWGFYGDQLLRISGMTLQTWSAVNEAEEGDDNGELYEVRYHNLYPWEPAGLWRYNQITPGVTQSEQLDPDELPVMGRGQGDRDVPPARAQSGSGEAVREAERYDQMPASRGVSFAGYLGQGGKRLIALPRQPQSTTEEDFLENDVVIEDGRAVPLDEEGDPIPPEDIPAAALVQPAHRGDGVVQTGVFEEHRTITGRWIVRTARGGGFIKRPSIPFPRRRKTPADPEGDSRNSGYAPSGLTAQSGGDAHDVRGDLVFPLGGRQRPATLPDLIAYWCNWEGLHPFEYHKDDWVTPDEGEGDLLDNQRTPTYDVLATAQELEDTTPVELDVDHRYPGLNYYENEAGFLILDDGQVVIYDGWGSRCVMGHGHVTWECSGDFNVRCGRHFTVFAGDDAVVRARSSIDLTATANDIRLSAFGSVWAVAGLGGCGGITLESKAACPAHAYIGRSGETQVTTGITMIAPNSTIYMLAPDFVYESSVDDGRVVLETGSQGVFRVLAQTHHSVVYPGGVRADLFSNATANEFTAGYTLLSQNLFVRGSVLATVDVMAAAGVYAAQSVHQGSGTGIVSSVDPDVITGTAAGVVSRVAAVGPLYAAALAAGIGPPHASEAEVTLRTPSQYRTQGGYEIWEGRWQLLARKAAQTLPTWLEEAVIGRTTSTISYPFPGAAWFDSQSYLQQEPVIVDPFDEWNARSRRQSPGGPIRTMYSAPTVPPPVRTSPAAGYTVTTPID